MARTIQYSSEFADELREDLDHLRRMYREEWIELLDLDLIDLERNLTEFPGAGRLFATRGRRELRRIRLRRTPLVLLVRGGEAQRRADRLAASLPRPSARTPAPLLICTESSGDATVCSADGNSRTNHWT